MAIRRWAGLEEMKHVALWIGTMQPEDADRVCGRERVDIVIGGPGRWGGNGSPAQVEKVEAACGLRMHPAKSLSCVRLYSTLS